MSPLPDLEPGTEPAGEDWIDAIEASVPAEPHHQNGHARVFERPEIRLGTDVHRVVDELQSAMAHDPLVYQRDRRLIIVHPAQPMPGVAKGTPVIAELDGASILTRLSRFARVTRVKAPSKLAAMMDPPPPPTIVETVCPPMYASALLKCRDYPSVRRLVGVSEIPVLRPDGTIHQDAGYDDATGFLFAPSSTFPRVPDRPTQADAIRALADLRHVFCDFPYASDASALVPIAAIMTIAARPAILGPVPAFLFDATTRGSGKTLQADVVSVIATGRSAARATYPENDEELAKALLAYALMSAQVVLLDNVTRVLGGGVLDAVLTARDDVQFRILGRNETPRLPWNTVLLVSGNNIALGEDTMRRTVIARLESDLENPEDRADFTHAELYDWARDERPRLVAAALTILRAYTAHGRPSAGTRWGSFEAWSSLIAGALAFARAPGLLDARPRGEASASDELTALAVILRDLPRLESGSITVADLVRRLYPPPGPQDPPDGFDDLRFALETLAPKRGPYPDARRVGEALRKRKGRVLNGRRLAPDGSSGGVTRWVVK